MQKFGIPIPPLLIAFLLVPMLEHSMRQTLLISGGDPSVFFLRPISGGFILATTVWLIIRIKRGQSSKSD